MNNNKVNLEKGYVLVYDFGEIRVHNYSTNDYLSDQVIMLEKDGKLLVIESPTFFDNNKELEKYISSINVKVEGILLAYHMSGANFLKGSKKFATHHSDEYGHNGGGKALIDGFIQSFGEVFDGSIHSVTDYINEGKVNIAGIDLNIISTSDTFDVEIPSINCIYTHMLGSKCHSIIAGKSHAEAMLSTLREYLTKGYNLIFTSHYVPEGLDAVKEKILYVQDVIDISKIATSKEDMIDRIKNKYSDYTGENYLEMTANFFFKN